MSQIVPSPYIRILVGYLSVYQTKSDDLGNTLPRSWAMIVHQHMIYQIMNKGQHYSRFQIRL